MVDAISAWAFWLSVLIALGIVGGAIVGYLYDRCRDKHERRFRTGEINAAVERCKRD